MASPHKSLTTRSTWGASQAARPDFSGCPHPERLDARAGRAAARTLTVNGLRDDHPAIHLALHSPPLPLSQYVSLRWES